MSNRYALRLAASFWKFVEDTRLHRIGSLNASMPCWQAWVRMREMSYANACESEFTQMCR